MNIDLTELTQLELMDLSNSIKDEYKLRENREKVMVYTVFIPFVFNIAFLNKENAINKMVELMAEDWVDSFKTEDDFIRLGVSFYDKSGLQFCEDYESIN